MADLVRITPCLWVDRDAEAAARFSISVFDGEMVGGADHPESDFAAHEDRFGVSWQVVPRDMGRLMGGGDPERAARVMRALLPMTKLDLATLEAAWAG